MPHILSIVIHAIKEVDTFLFEAPKFDDQRRAEALQVASRSMIWFRV